MKKDKQKKLLFNDKDLTGEELHAFAQNGGALDFLNKKEEDIYSDKDLTVKKARVYTKKLIRKWAGTK